MAHKIPHKQEKIEVALIEQIATLNIPGSLTQRINWLIREGIAAHPEITEKAEKVDPALAEISATVEEREGK